MSDEELRIDHDDPMYLHPSEHPGLILITSAFDGRNFSRWRRYMQLALSAKNKISFVTGSLERPVGNLQKLQIWERCNAMVISWIINALSPEIRRSVMYMETAQGIWEELDARFGQAGGAQLYAIQKECVSLQQGTSSISAYFNAKKALLDELYSLRKLPSCTACTCGFDKEILKYEDNQKLFQFLMGLNDSYTAARDSILMMQPLPNLNLAYSMLRQEETLRGLLTTPNSNFLKNATSLHTKTSQNQPSSSQSQPGRSVVHGKGSGERKSYFCTNCKKTNHNIDRCNFIIGFPPKRGGKGKKPTEEKFAAAATQNGMNKFSQESVADHEYDAVYGKQRKRTSC